jgi:hypothetical protein
MGTAGAATGADCASSDAAAGLAGAVARGTESAARHVSPVAVAGPDAEGATGAVPGWAPVDIPGSDEGGVDGGALGVEPGTAGMPVLCPHTLGVAASNMNMHAANWAVRTTACLPAKLGNPLS